MYDGIEINSETTPIDIYDYILRKMDFVVSEDNPSEVYVYYQDYDSNWNFRKLTDSKFKAFVRTVYRELSNDDIAPSFEGILSKYKDIAVLEERKVQVLSRIGGTSDETVYYLANEKNTVVCINAEGYKFYKRYGGYHFLKKQNTLQQVIPKSRSKSLLDELTPFVNMDDDTKILFAVTLVQQFIFTSSHFLPVICAEQGSGKSTFTRLWRTILDPAQAIITTMPENSDGLKNHLANNHVVCFDNTQPLSLTFSDVLCGAITGTSYTKRKLYSDSDEMVWKLHNIVIINGIDVIPRRSDLLQRALLFPLQKITDKTRKPETEIKNQFRRALPYILGAVFETLSQYFKVKSNVKVKGNHRMSDAYRDSYIIATILGVEDEFLKAFNDNQKLLNDDYSETNPLISAIAAYMEDISRTQITDSVAALFNEIREYADKTIFPRSPSAFSREVTRQEDALKHAGFKVSLIKKRQYTEMTIRRQAEQ